jgi:hypothetical protein
MAGIDFSAICRGVFCFGGSGAWAFLTGALVLAAGGLALQAESAPTGPRSTQSANRFTPSV